MSRKHGEKLSDSDQLYKLDTVAVHMSLLHTNKVIVFSGDDKKIWKWWKGKSSVWNPESADKEENPKLVRNLFCAGHCLLPDGRLLVAGGQSTVHNEATAFFSFLGLLQIFTRGADHDINIFDPEKNMWNSGMKDFQPVTKMPKARWYPTCITLPDGKALIVSGIYSQGHYAFLKRFGRFAFINEDYEIFDPEKNKLSAPAPFLRGIRAYPFLQVLPGGTLFVHYVNTTRLWNIAEKKFYPEEFTTNLEATRTYDGMGSCALLPMWPSDEKAQILIVGGSTSLIPDETTPATNHSEIFEFNPDTPNDSAGWRKTKHPTNIQRFLSDSVLLPDGTVLVTNGASKGISDHNHDSVRIVEIFEPKTETWKKLNAPLKRDRLYHGTAILLRDGKVVVAGSTGHKWPPSNNEKYIEIITPPYLANKPTRPKISSYPKSISYDSAFQISVDDVQNIEKVSLIRVSSTMHNNNMDQRCLFLNILEKFDNTIKSYSPKDGTWAPPGYYMLFVVDEKGIPSLGEFVRLN